MGKEIERKSLVSGYDLRKRSGRAKADDPVSPITGKAKAPPETFGAQQAANIRLGSTQLCPYVGLSNL